MNTDPRLLTITNDNEAGEKKVLKKKKKKSSLYSGMAKLAAMKTMAGMK